MAVSNSTKRHPNFIDLTGQQFGKWTVLEFHSRINDCTRWLCRCECGKEKPVDGASLRKGKSISCPSCAHSIHGNPGAHGVRFKDLTGQVFGRWTVLNFHSRSKNGASVWLCRCECGAFVPVVANSLQTGNSRSCVNCAIRTIHGMAGTLEYNTWSAMLFRCSNPKAVDYALYGGRGIRVCERWKVIENFIEDMGPRPSVKHSIDRIDNDGNYEPNNCRWATPIEQGRNRRGNRMLTYNGMTLCMAELAEEFGINQVTLSGRLKRGWSVERAITTPVCVHRRKR